MSDLANNFYNAWCPVFSTPHLRLFCHWHLDKAWQKHLKEGNAAKPTQEFLYKFLKRLLTEVHEEKIFREEFGKFLTLAQQTHPVFHKYFQTYYSHNYTSWAACFRTEATSNTNMYVEAFHRVIKYDYLDGKQNRRMDKFINALVQYSRDTIYQEARDELMTPDGYRLNEINKRHHNCEKLQVSAVGSQWEVLSELGKDKYKVSLAQLECDCKLRCRTCKVCPHRYICTCPDYKNRNVNCCKHIHAVHIQANAGQSLEVPMINNDDHVHHLDEILHPEKDLFKSYKQAKSFYFQRPDPS